MISKISTLRSGSPIPCSTTRSRTGNCSAMALTCSSVRSAGGSRLRKVRMHVWHFESQRLVVSRYSDRGSAATTGGRRASAMALPNGSTRRDDGRAGAGHLREILTLCPLPVERDPLAARERAVRVGSVEPSRKRAPACAAAAAGTIPAGRRHLPRLDELRGVHDGPTKAG